MPAGLSGRSVGEATQALKNAGLTVKGTVPEHSNAVPDGRVLSTDPTEGSKVDPGSAVTLMVAKNTVPVDLIAAAGEATWTNGSGAKLSFAGSDDGKAGRVRQFTDTVQGSLATVLETNPQETGAVSGVYKLTEPVVAGDHVLARVGLLKQTTSGQSQAGGQVEQMPMTFQIEINTKVVKTVTVSTKDNKFQDLDADLSSAQGASSVKITVLADKSVTKEWKPVWQNPRLEPKTGQ